MRFCEALTIICFFDVVVISYCFWCDLSLIWSSLSSASHLIAVLSFLQADVDIDIESIPLPASVMSRKSASFRHTDPTAPKFKSRASLAYPPMASSKQQTNHVDGSRFKLTDILHSQKSRITSIDVHQYPALNHLNATLKRICRSNEPSLDHQNRMPFESFTIDAETYHEMVAKNQPLPMDVSGLRDTMVRPSMSNLTSSTLADIQSVHASTCNLVTALRASSQSIGAESGGNAKFGRNCSSNSAMNLKYDSLRSHKARSKRSNSEQLNSSYYHFQNIDGEMDNNSTTFDSVLLPAHSTDNYKLPWKHRQCPSITSSTSSSNSSNMSSKCIGPISAVHFFISKPFYGPRNRWALLRIR